MTSSVQSLTLIYDAPNERGTFSGGDALRGTVSLTVAKDITVQTLFVKFKGDANVQWSQKSGEHTHSYSAHRRYFKLKQVLIPESSKDTPVPQGVHVYKFSFDIPGNVPPSLRLNNGKIVYKLEAVLSRSWRLNRTVEKDIVVVHQSFPDLYSLMSQQMGSTDKEMGLFSKGHTHMDVIVDRRAYAPGEKMMIVAKVNNSSSRDMTPKFSLNQDVVYRANCKAKCEKHVIHKATGDCIKPQTQAEVRCEITIPPNLTQTVQNCDILLLEYCLKVYLDISFAVDPEVKLPVVILPYNITHGLQPGLPTGPYPPGGFGAPNKSDFPPPGAFAGPHPAVGPGGPVTSNFPPPGAFGGPCPAGGFGGPVSSGFPPPGVPGGPCPPPPYSGYYGYSGAPSCPAPPAASPNNPPVYAGPPAVRPPQPSDTSGSYSNPAPQRAAPYSSPFSSSSSSPVLHPPPSVPAFPPPDAEPPSYSSLLNPSPAPPAYNPLPSAPMMSMDFLSHTDEAPPAYSVPSLLSDTKKANSTE